MTVRELCFEVPYLLFCLFKLRFKCLVLRFKNAVLGFKLRQRIRKRDRLLNQQLTLLIREGKPFSENCGRPIFAADCYERALRATSSYVPLSGVCGHESPASPDPGQLLDSCLVLLRDQLQVLNSFRETSFSNNCSNMKGSGK